MELPSDLREFVELLNDHEVRYLIVGGLAVAFHGYPRYTGDIDVWVDGSPENADRMLRVLETFGFGSLGLSQEDFTKPDMVVQLGYEPCRIDVMTSLKAVDSRTRGRITWKAPSEQ